MSKYNIQDNNFVALNETSGILQNMTSSNVEYVVCAGEETPTANTGIRINPSKKLKFCQTVGTSYVRIIGNTTGDVIVTPNECGTGSGGTNTVVYNHVTEWAANTLYTEGRLVIKDNKLYKCVEPNNKSYFDVDDWQEIGGGTSGGVTRWAENTEYAVDTIVIHGNTLYICTEEHTSSTDFEDDASKWVVITDDVGTTLPDWRAREKYAVDDIVNVNGFIYRCKREHIALNTFANASGITGDEADWELINWVDWSAETQYIEGQVVYADNAFWRCISNHISDSTAITNDMVSGYEKWVKIGSYTLPVATDSVLGGVKVGSTVEVNSAGVLNVKKASASQLGGVKIGGGINVASDGTISVPAVVNNDITPWASGTEYSVGQFVIYDNNLYECRVANSDETFDDSKWQIIGGNTDDDSFDITPWVSGTSYALGDLVIYENVLYQCTTANSDVAFDSENWMSIGATENDLRNWESGTSYKVGNFVVKDNKLYKCTTANNDLEFDSNKWQEIGDMSEIYAWESSTSYSVGDYVIYDNRVYQCDTANDDETFDPSKWTDIGTIQSYVKKWTSGTSYSVGDLVMHQNAIYKCTSANSDTVFTPSKWEVQIDNSKAITAWTSGTSYSIGQYVVYDAKIYECTTPNSDTVFDDTKWQLLNEPKGIMAGDWTANTTYKCNQLVKYDGDLYMCLTAHTSTAFKTNYDNGCWLKINHSIPAYKKNKFYAKDSVVTYGGEIWKCIKSHTSLGDSPLDVPAFEFGGFSWEDPWLWDDTREVIYDFGSERSIAYATLVTTTHRAADYIKSVEIYVMDGNGSGANVVETLVNESSVTLTTATTKFSFTPTTARYVKVRCKIYQVGYTYTRIYLNKVIFGDGTKYWEEYARPAVTAWEGGKAYELNDLVYNNGLYLCKVAHTSGTFATDLANGKWEKVNDNLIPTWATSTAYAVNQMVNTTDGLYICKTAHTSGTFDTDLANGKWEAVGGGAGVVTWEANKLYKANVLTVRGNALYVCTADHTSSSAFDTDLSAGKWMLLNGNGGGAINQPLGSIIAFMGTTAPANYLACDGTVYNITDYQELADYINAQFGSYDFFGGNGTTTFAVPDLRGEFLRGTGTNSHTNQGDGANVGVHQDGTFITALSTGDNAVYTYKGNKNYRRGPFDAEENTTKLFSVSGSFSDISSSVAGGNTRPTNTSVLYCIRYNHPEPMANLNVLQDTLYTGTVGQNTGDFNITMSNNINDYDYLLVKHGKFTTANATLIPVDTRLFTSGGGYFISWFYGSNNYAGWIVATSNTVLNFHISNSTDTTDIVPREVVGIKFVNPNVYSTTEQRIGTWIDGKPLYQKTYSGTIPSGADSANTNIFVDVNTLENLDKVFISEGYVLCLGDYLAINESGEQGKSSRIWISTSQNSIRGRVGSSFINCPIVITIKYTKTTD